MNRHAGQVAADLLTGLVQGLIGQMRYIAVQTGSQVQKLLLERLQIGFGHRDSQVK